jgi:hypothetical protein
MYGEYRIIFVRAADLGGHAMKPTTLFGSDVYEDYTAIYTWNSNQMAHAMMGFAGTTLLAHGAVELGMSPWWALLFAVIPALKDATDYAVDLTRAGHIFEITEAHERETRADGFTDNYFWNVGTLLAVFLAVSTATEGWPLYVLFGVAIAYAMVGIFWLGGHFNAQKLRFDTAALPYFFRLPNFAGNLVGAFQVTESGDGDDGGRKAAIQGVEAFTYDHEDAARHLIVSGPARSRKTTLASAIGSGLTVRDTTVRYLSQTALVDALAMEQSGEERAKTEPLPPLLANVIIVDDVGAALPDESLPRKLAERRTVWVIADPTSADHWRRRLRGLLSGPMLAVELGPPREDERVDKRATPLWVTLLSLATLVIASVATLGSLGLVLCG